MSALDDFAAELERRETQRLIDAGWDRAANSDTWHQPPHGPWMTREQALEQVWAECRKQSKQP